MRAVCTNIAGPDVLLSAREEADSFGVHVATVSRDRQDPTHPVNGPGRAVKPLGGARYGAAAPYRAIKAWRADKAARQAPKKKPPVGLTRAGWAALHAISAGGTAGSTITRRLTAGGWLDDGQLTDKASALLAAHPQEATDV